jgi:predicted anti-sigma-YlaC factor YlaD
MHRMIQDHLEEVLAGTLPAGHQVYAHLKDCVGCRDEVDGMRLNNELLHAWSLPAEVEPRPGFYARVLERIEAHRPVSIWALFMDSMTGRYLVTASLAVAAVMFGFVAAMEQPESREFAAQTAQVEMDPLYPSAGFSDAVIASNAPNNGTVLMSLVSYQGR